ncbi:MAG: TldD/PmbA family protein [Desulfobacteraceae bacterium]|nr:MAG: TldD/PmbA family protein [Desulfobacteraceae bacterium]
MNQGMSKLCQRLLKLAKQNGAEACRVGLAKARQVDIAYREQKPETVKEALTQVMTLEIFVDQRYSAQTTSDLREQVLPGFVANAVANTRLINADPFRSLPDPSYYRGRAAMDLKVCDPDYERVTPEKRHDLLKTIEAACRAEAGSKLVSATAGLRDRFYEYVDMTSNGFEGYTRETGFLASASVSVQDQDERRPQSYYYHHVRHFKDLASPAEIGRRAARRALGMLGGRKIKTETLPVIVENLNIGRLIRGLQEALSGYNIQQKQSFLADKKGQKIGSDVFTLVDDPLLVSGPGSCLFDDDGLTSAKRTIFETGTLKNFFIDWYYSRKLGWEPTSGSASNLILTPGKRSVEQIMRDLGRGIFISDFIGGNANVATGDFSMGISGFLFENGVPAQPVAEMNLAGNHLTFWSKLAEAADDPWLHNEWRIPSLVFGEVVVSGV